jgi:predicted DNA repair protein MutK
MAAGSLLALLDDIATVLDDVTLMTKVAAKKTAGVLGDDLALNAQQVTGVDASRELPVVWAVAKGSLWNKAILVPAALLISAFAPWLIIPLLMIGGAFLCFEGAEKLAHKFLHSPEEDAAHKERLAAALAGKEDMVALEKDKIKGAIRTDFILSAEIIVISLGTVSPCPSCSRWRCWS